MTLTDDAPTGVDEPAQPQRPAWDTEGMLLAPGTRLVHIGPHKTGTTGLQASLFMARDELERQRVHYASHGRHAMTAVVAGLGLPNAWSEDRKPPPRWKWQRLVRDVRTSKADRVIMSSEFFADGRPDAIKRVIDDLDPSRVHVVVTLRPLAKIIPSQWQQWVQNLWTTPLDQWVRDILERPDGQAGTPFWRRHRHDELIERWASVVGKDRLTAIALDERDHEMVLRVFERLTGLTENTLNPVASLSNRSMTLPEIEVIRAFNVAYKEQKLPRRLYMRVMRFGAASLMEGRSPQADEARIELPEWSREPIATASRQVIEGIRRSGVRVIGDLDALAHVPPSKGEEKGPVVVSPEVAAAAAIGVLVASGLARGTGAITVDADEGDEEMRPLKAPPPVQEPFELLRISSTQLGLILLRRARAALGRPLEPVRFWRRR